MWLGSYCGGTEAVIPRARAGPPTTWDTNCRISYLMSPLRLRPDDADDADADKAASKDLISYFFCDVAK